MIITESAPKMPPKSSTPLLGASSGSGVPPPAYTARDAPVGAAHAGPQAAIYQPVYPQPQLVGESAGRRFFKAFMVALGLWLLASALVTSVVDDGAIGRFRDNEYPVPTGVHLTRCITDWSEGETTKTPVFTTPYPYGTTVSFDFSMPPETLLLMSKGSLSSGQLKVTTADTTDVKVKVTVYYHNQRARDTAKICMVSRKDGEQGVGIFTPKWWQLPRDRNLRLSFDVELILPRGSALSSPQSVNALSTDVDNFSHEVDSLEDIFNFRHLSLTGSNGKISARSLRARDATLKTSNGAIIIDSLSASTAKLTTSDGLSLVALNAAVRSSNGGISGSFNVCESLDLTTSNGPIVVTVGINSSDSSKASTLTMRTSNALLASTIDLHTASGKGGKFPITATTSNARLSTTIAALPLDAVLKLEARTSNDLAEATVPLTYEGAFSLTTSNEVPSVRRADPKERDPACAEDGVACDARRRTVETRVVKKNMVMGVTYWDKANARRGDVSMRTSNGHVTLTL
ncbi:hypothetical protein GGX14DRAFT_469498 [Mycena pura]|uniref:Adhesin domain-containing protein n=1 Tax=Mycena pura TaxID=153505 RepID=A0AAD6Y490_9AGAR|nr:hypothetical protein GGX14DRAFT_469498 [Mycena pura]